MATVSGVVTEKWSGKPVADATVMLNSYMATSASDGSFSITVPDERYTLKVLHRDYKLLERTLDLRMTPTRTIRVELTPVFKAL